MRKGKEEGGREDRKGGTQKGRRQGKKENAARLDSLAVVIFHRVRTLPILRQKRTPDTTAGHPFLLRFTLLRHC